MHCILQINTPIFEWDIKCKLLHLSQASGTSFKESWALRCIRTDITRNWPLRGADQLEMASHQLDARP